MAYKNKKKYVKQFRDGSAYKDFQISECKKKIN